jgi:hypothetical protein
MILPLIFIILGTVASAFMSYGTHPVWAHSTHGLALILWTRRLQWPLIAFTLVMCVALLVLIVSGKRRAWWLIGLAPILALFAHKFHTAPGFALNVTDTPAFVSADAAPFLADETYVVGVMFNDQPYAFSYPVLFNTPCVIVQDREKKMVLFWSADANRAVAARVDLDLRARDLEVVSTPANSILVYNSRLGEFIVGVTGKTPDGQSPDGFHESLQVVKTTWAQWRDAFPKTHVMAPPPGNVGHGIAAPAGPILPRFPMPDVFNGLDPETRIAVVQTTPPAAIEADALTGAPANLTIGKEPVLLVRDGPGQSIRAFDRRIDGDFYVRLKPHHDAKKPSLIYFDPGSNSYWSHNLIALEGGPELKGKRLSRIAIDEGLYWGVMKYWYRDLQLYKPN